MMSKESKGTKQIETPHTKTRVEIRYKTTHTFIILGKKHTQSRIIAEYRIYIYILYRYITLVGEKNDE